jgi:sarcosine oxidase delta subunit
LAVYCKFCQEKYESERGYSKGQKAIDRAKRWSRKNPDRYRAAQLRSYLKLRGDAKSYTEILEDMTSGIKCPYCGDTLTYENLSYDHRDGSGSEILPCCVGCNLVKHIFDYEDFMKIVALLGAERIRYYHGKTRRVHVKTPA